MAGIRKHLLSILLLLCCPGLLPSPSAAAPLVGVIMTGNTPYFGEIHRSFVEALQAGGPPGTGPVILLQRPFPDAIALSNAARKLIAADSDVIIAYGTPATMAILKEKSRVPVIYGGIYDPAQTGISGSRVTGCGYKVPLSSLLRYLREIRTINTLTVIYSDSEDDSRRQLVELEQLAAEQQIRLNPINLLKAADLAKLSGQVKGEAALLTGSSLVDLWLDRILSVLKERQLPSASILPDRDGSGVTLTLHHSPADQGQKIAEIARQVLAGRDPQEILPETSRNTELVFNLKEAKNLGIKIPFQLVAEATRVVK